MSIVITQYRLVQNQVRFHRSLCRSSQRARAPPLARDWAQMLPFKRRCPDVQRKYSV